MAYKRLGTRAEHRPTSLAISMEEGRIEFNNTSLDTPTDGRDSDRPLLTRQENSEPVFTIDNRIGLAHDLGFLSTMPELCDVTFLVGEDRHPVCGVKAILATRSRVFRRLLFQQDSVGVPKKVKKKPGFYRVSSDGVMDKTDFKGQSTVVIEDFQLEVFKQLMEYIHTGSVMLQSRTLLGLMNAADHYGLDDLKQACVQFLEQAINTDTVCVLLSSAEKYIQYKSTKILVQKMLEFVDNHAEVVLNLGSFSTLPQHVVRIVLGRDELLASEETKFEAAFRWCLRYIDDHPDIDLKTAFEPFVSQIEFYKMSANHLMKKVKPAQVVDDTVILTALAFQADPQSVEDKVNIKPKRQLNQSGPSIRSLDSSPPQFRRVKSSGVPIKSLTGEIDQSDIDGIQRLERGGSVPPGEDRAKYDLHPNRVFEIRVDSRTSELSLSTTGTTGSTNSLSSCVPVSPVIIRSASSSSYQSNQSNDIDSRLQQPSGGSSTPEIFVTTTTSSLV